MDSKIHQEARLQRRISTHRRQNERKIKRLSRQSADKNRVDPKTVLTQREREVLVGIACGARDEEIAKNLNMSLTEVEAHIHVIYRKLNAPDRLQALLWAAQYL